MPKRHSQPSRRQTTQSNTYRFFVDSQAIQGSEVRIEDTELVHQLNTVLRLGANDQVVLLDNTGWQYTTTIKRIDRGCVVGMVESKEQAHGEPRAQLTLYVALIRPEKFEWVLQKGTELGVSTFAPIITERSLASDTNNASDRKTVRWNKILREAAEQSRRGKIPRLLPTQSFNDVCHHASEHSTPLLLWEGSGASPLRRVLHSMPSSNDHAIFFSLISGPEGGFAEKELETARDYGIISVTLGPRTLRAETAPLVAATAMFYEMGDLD